jgi:hypothetical protein
MRIKTVEIREFEIGDKVTIAYGFICNPHAGMEGEIVDIDLEGRHIVKLIFEEENQTRYRIFTKDQLDYKEEK